MNRSQRVVGTMFPAVAVRRHVSGLGLLRHCTDTAFHTHRLSLSCLTIILLPHPLVFVRVHAVVLASEHCVPHRSTEVWNAIIVRTVRHAQPRFHGVLHFDHCDSFILTVDLEISFVCDGTH